MTKSLVLSIFLCFASINSIFAWGPRGHKIISQIAQKYLNKSVADSVDFYLDDISFVKASYWMDEVKMNISYDFMKPWHFVTIPVDKTYVRTKNPDIINVLENVITKLKTKKAGPKNEVQLALKVLLHLMGDLHQPLNCGFARDNNGFNSKLRFFFKSTNLHDVWEFEILEYQSITTEECLALANNLSKAEITSMQSGDVMKWTQESRLLLADVYDFKGNKLGDEYLEKNSRVLKMQLIKAGIRLAGTLNQIYKK